MKTPSISAGGILAIVGVAIGGYVVYRLYKGGGSIISGAVDAVKQGAANVTQAWNNATSAPAQQTTRNLLYGNEAYTGSASGNDADLPTSGEWFGDELARRYSYEQRDAGGAPAAESINGAAFGVYPSAGRRGALPSQVAYQAPPNTTNGQNQADRPPLSFMQGGASFKDLAGPDAINVFDWPSGPLGQVYIQ